jgi:hypothetical protein
MPRPVPNPGSHIFDFIKSLHPPMHFPHSVYLISFYALLVYTLHIFIGLGILTWPVKLAGKSLARIYVYTKIFVGLPFTPYIFSQLLNTCLYLWMHTKKKYLCIVVTPRSVSLSVVWCVFEILILRFSYDNISITLVHNVLTVLSCIPSCIAASAASITFLHMCCWKSSFRYFVAYVLLKRLLQLLYCIYAVEKAPSITVLHICCGKSSLNYCVAYMLWKKLLELLCCIYAVEKAPWITVLHICCGKSSLNYCVAYMLWKRLLELLCCIYAGEKAPWINVLHMLKSP